MDEQNEIAELRAEVRFLDMTMKCALTVMYGFISLMTAELALKADTFGTQYEYLLGGAELPYLTQFIFNWYWVITAVILGGAVLVIVLVFKVKARWPMRLLILSTLVCAVLYRLILKGLFSPAFEMISQIAA